MSLLHGISATTILPYHTLISRSSKNTKMSSKYPSECQAEYTHFVTVPVKILRKPQRYCWQLKKPAERLLEPGYRYSQYPFTILTNTSLT